MIGLFLVGRQLHIHLFHVQCHQICLGNQIDEMTTIITVGTNGTVITHIDGMGIMEHSGQIDPMDHMDLIKT